jgi:hypothetical protein
MPLRALSGVDLPFRPDRFFDREDFLLYLQRNILHRPGDKGSLEHFVDTLHKFNVQILEDVRGNVDEILLVFLGDDDHLDAGTMGRQEFLLETADGKHPSPERDLTGHGQITPDRPLCKR